MKKIKILTTAFLTFGFAPATFASDWPVWGGNGSRNMISQEKEVVMDFNPGEMDDNEKVDLSTTQNVKGVEERSTFSLSSISPGLKSITTSFS
jgi:hypothetical protein